MKKGNLMNALIFAMLLMSVTILSCKKEDPIVIPIINLPEVSTNLVTNVTETSAASGGNAISDGGATITAKGVCWSINKQPTIADSISVDGTGTGTFTSTVTGLLDNTTYHLRAYATNSKGTAYGNEDSFTTIKSIPTSIMDVDGNVYNTVTIGTQVWLKENLRTTKYNDGSAIVYPGTNNATWQNNTTGAYAWYANDIANKSIYGALYNWHAVNTGKLAPEGWHVATDAEWKTLTDFLSGENIAGGQLKEAGTAHWITPNTDATNLSFFTGLPGGSRDLGGSFDTKGYNGYFWTSTSVSTTDAYSRYLYFGNGFVYNYSYNKSLGYSVRCVID